MRQITGTGSTYPTNPVICILGTDWGKGSGGGPWVWKFGWKIDTNGNPVINDNIVVTVFSTIFPNSPQVLHLKVVLYLTLVGPRFFSLPAPMIQGIASNESIVHPENT